MKKIVLLVLLFMLIGKSASAYDMERFRRMPSCVFAERLDSIDGLENNGWTVSGNPTVATSPYKSAVSFDGTGDYVTCLTSVDQYDFGATGDFSVLFWIKTTDDSHAVMGNKRIDSNTKGWSVRIGAGGTIALKVADGSNYTEVTSVVMNDGVWHSIAFTVDRNSNSYPYVDGVQGTAVANVESGDDITSTDNLVIGADANAGFATDSEMFNVMVFDRELSATEVSQIYNDTVFDYPLNEVAHYDMSEINPQDIGWVGSGADGTGTNIAAADIVQEHDGGYAIDFDGTSEYITVTNDDVFEFGTGDFSIGYWKKSSNTDAEDHVMHKGAWGAVGFRIDGDTQDKLTFQEAAGYTSFLAPSDCSDGNWHLVVFSQDRDGSGIGYRDAVAGTAQDISTRPGTISNTGKTLTFASGGAARYLDCVLSEVWAWDMALTQLQVEDLYITTR